MSVDLEVVPGDGHRPGRGGCRDGHHVAHRVRPGQGDLEGDHAAQRAADDELEHARSRGRRAAATVPGPGPVSRPPGSAAPYGRPRPRVERGRAGRAIAAAEQVRGDDADALGVERPARPDERRPPVAGRVGRPGQGMDDERPAAPRPAADRHAGRRRSAPAGSSRRRARTDPARSTRGGPSRSEDGPPRSPVGPPHGRPLRTIGP